MEEKIKIISDDNNKDFAKIFDFLIDELDYDYGNYYNKMKKELKLQIHNNKKSQINSQNFTVGYVREKTNDAMPSKKSDQNVFFCVRKSDKNYFLENDVFEKYINIFFNKNSQKILENNINSHSVFYTKIFVRKNGKNSYFKSIDIEELEIDVFNFNMIFENKMNETIYFYMNFTFLFEEFEFFINKNTNIESTLNDNLELHIK